MKDPALLQVFPRSGFIPAKNEDYKAIEETAVALDIMDKIEERQLVHAGSADPGLWWSSGQLTF